MITAEQLRAARGALRMDQAVLAKQAGVSVETIKRLERGSGPLRAQRETLDAIRGALEHAGIAFVDQEKGELFGAGIRMVEDWPRLWRKHMREAASNFATASSYLHEGESPDFMRRGFRYVFEVVMKDFTDQLKQELRKWAEAGDIKEPQDRRQRGTSRSG